MESVEFEAKRSFFAGSEAMFKIMDSLSGLKTNHALRLLSEYREMNRTAAMETVPDDEQDEQL